eukprot:Gb_38825 [translate_table: standard]
MKTPLFSGVLQGAERGVHPDQHRGAPRPHRVHPQTHPTPHLRTQCGVCPGFADPASRVREPGNTVLNLGDNRMVHISSATTSKEAWDMLVDVIADEKKKAEANVAKLFVTIIHSDSSGNWFLDFEATQHIPSERKWSVSYNKIPKGRNVMLGDDCKHGVVGQGNIAIKMSYDRIVTKGVWEGDLCKLCTEVSQVECNQNTANEANCEQQNSPTTRRRRAIECLMERGLENAIGVNNLHDFCIQHRNHVNLRMP